MPAHERCNEVARKVIDEPSEDIVANAKKERAAKRNPFARIALFIRQVIGELKKVVTPTRKECASGTIEDCQDGPSGPRNGYTWT